MNRALRDRWRAWGPNREPLASLLIAASIALYLLFVLVSWHRRDGMTEVEEWLTFVQGWLLVPALALAATAILQTVLARRPSDRSRDLWLLACSSAASLLLAVAALRTAVGRGAALGVAEMFAWLALPATTIAVLVVRPRLASFPTERLALITLLLWSGLILLLTLTAPPTLAVGVGFSVLGLALLVLIARRVRTLPRWWSRLTDALVLLAIPLLVLDPRVSFDLFHFNWFLGPANALMHGRTILVETFSPYGILLLEFLALVFGATPLPLSYVGLALLNAALIVLQVVAVYALLRLVLDSRVGAILGLLVALALNGIGEIALYPSSGPLRFGLPWLLPLLVALRTARPSTTTATRLAEGAVVGIASLWETQTFLAAMATWLGVLAGDAAFTSRLRRGWLASVARRLLWGALCMLLVHAIFALRVRWAAGVWPQWDRFFALVRSFSPTGEEGWVLFPAPAWGGGDGIVLVYLISLLACVHAVPVVAGRLQAARLTVVLSLTLMGIAQLTYWVGTSVFVRLYAVALPTVVVAAYWLERLLHEEMLLPSGVRGKAVACLVLCALLLTSPAEAPLRAWLEKSTIVAVLGGGTFDGCGSARACQPSTPPALDLVSKYAANAQRLGVFLDPRATTEVLVMSKRAHVFPMTDAAHDSLAESNIRRIAAAPHGMRAGDVIFSDRGLMGTKRRDVPMGTALLSRLQARICAEFHCAPLEQRGPVTAMRLFDLPSAPDLGNAHADEPPPGSSVPGRTPGSSLDRRTSAGVPFRNSSAARDEPRPPQTRRRCKHMAISGSLSVVVPAYNEGRRIGATLEAIRDFLARKSYPAEIVVVDDGSSDETGEAVRRTAHDSVIPVRLIRYPENRGKGFALKVGFRAAQGDAILFTDADLSTSIEQVDQLLARLEEGADVAIGTRKAEGATIRVPQPWYRTFMGKVFTRLVREMLVDVSDVTCGFKLFRGSLGRDVFSRLRISDWSFDAEALVIARRLGARIEEVPVVWEDQAGTKVRLLRDALGSAIGLLRILISSAAGRYGMPHDIDLVTEEWTNGIAWREVEAFKLMDRR